MTHEYCSSHIRRRTCTEPLKSFLGRPLEIKRRNGASGHIGAPLFNRGAYAMHEKVILAEWSRDVRLPGSCLFHSRYTCINVYVEMYNYVQMSMCIHIKCSFIYDSLFQLYMFCHILRSVKSAVGTSPSADRWMAYYISILNSNWSVCMKSVCMKPVLPQRSRGIALTEDNPLSHHIVPLHGFH